MLSLVARFSARGADHVPGQRVQRATRFGSVLARAGESRHALGAMMGAMARCCWSAARTRSVARLHAALISPFVGPRAPPPSSSSSFPVAGLAPAVPCRAEQQRWTGGAVATAPAGRELLE